MSFRIWFKERKIKKLKGKFEEMEKFKGLCGKEEELNKKIEGLEK